MGNRKTDEQRIFTVEGRGEFPFDMLRYDMCWPYSGEDSALLSHHYNREVRRVVLQGNSAHQPTDARWRSFNWRIINYGIHRMDKPRDDGTWIEPGHEPGV